MTEKPDSLKPDLESEDGQKKFLRDFFRMDREGRGDAFKAIVAQFSKQGSKNE